MIATDTLRGSSPWSTPSAYRERKVPRTPSPPPHRPRRGRPDAIRPAAVRRLRQHRQPDLRAFHHDDIDTPVDPSTLAERLDGAKFETVSTRVEADDGLFAFWARRRAAASR